MIAPREAHQLLPDYGAVSLPTNEIDRILSDATTVGLTNPDVIISISLWLLALLYTIPTLFWDFEFLVYHYRRWQQRRQATLDIEWGLDAVQIRIVTIDNQDVVQQTVDLLPDAVQDIVVIAERPIDVTGATVVAVPPEFTCEATHKGRAVEWARRYYPTEKEYVLYLDEDTDASQLTGIPSNADIVQFRERPSRSSSLIPYLAEIHRIGYNIEQRSFPFFQLPFYAWGGGIAIRRSLEESVTWDTRTIVEDSVFAWRAVLEFNATLDVVDIYFSNQSPPSIWAMIMQRRRWLTGTRQRQEMLPVHYRAVYAVRDLGWALSTFGPILWVFSVLSYAGYINITLLPVFFPTGYTALTLTLLAHVYFWSLFGLLIYRPPIAVWGILLVFTPFIVTIHSLGAIYGVVRPVKTFVVTPKVIAEVVGRDDHQPDETPPEATPPEATPPEATSEKTPDGATPVAETPSPDCPERPDQENRESPDQGENRS